MQPKLIGLIIILLGVILLLNNLEITDVSIGRLIATYWPVILLIWGIEIIASKVGKRKNSGSIITGIVLLGLGIIFLGRNTGLFEFDLSIVWKLIIPLLLILAGWSMLRGTIKSSGGTRFAFMSGIELKNKGWKLENGNFFAFMGGAEMDLTVADIPDEEVRLGLTAVMGGIEIKVPAGLPIEGEGTALLGGIDFLGEESGGIFTTKKLDTWQDSETGRKLIINGTAIMGGIKIKS